MHSRTLFTLLLISLSLCGSTLLANDNTPQATRAGTSEAPTAAAETPPATATDSEVVPAPETSVPEEAIPQLEIVYTAGSGYCPGNPCPVCFPPRVACKSACDASDAACILACELAYCDCAAQQCPYPGC